jgi:hypothetical protein
MGHLCKIANSSLMITEAFHERLIARSKAVAPIRRCLPNPLRRGEGLALAGGFPTHNPWRCV